MNVDLVRTLELRSADPAPAARGDKAGSGFADLMDSMLGGGTGDRPDAREGAQSPPARAANADAGARPERSPRSDRSERSERSGRTARSERGDRTASTERSPRGERRDDADESARTASQEGSDDAGDRPVEAGTGTAAGASGRRGAAGRKGEAVAEEDEASTAPGTPTDPVVVAAAAGAAVPEWIALALAAGEPATDAVAEEAPADTDAVGAGALAVGAVAAGSLATAAGEGTPGGPAEASSAADPASAFVARDAASDPAIARPLIAAVEAAREGAAKDEAAPAGAAEAQSAEAVSPTPVEAPTRGDELARVRADAPRAEGPRREAEPAIARSAEAVAGPELAGVSARTGDEGAAQDRPRDPQAGLAPTLGADRPAPTSAPAPAAEAAAQAPDETLDASGRPQDVSAQARVEGMMLAPTARAQEPLSPMQTGRPMPASAPDSIAAQADWLATRGGGTARLVLHPPELGEIAIRVTVRNQAVDVVMVAHTALAHQVAEDQSDRLSQAFASRDLRLEQFEVRRGDPSDASSTGQFGSSDAGARERERAQDEGQVDRGGAGQGGRRRGAAGVEAVVAPPRIASNGRASGIDLRI